MKRRAAGILVLTGLLVATPAWAATVDVRVGDYYFDDQTAGDSVVAADAGDILRFAFESTHSATVDGVFDSGTRGRGETYSSPPLRAGRYLLYCTVHGEQQHSASLVVRGKASAAPSPTRAASPSPSPFRTVASPRPVASSAAPSLAPSPSRSPSPSPKPSVIAAPALPSSPPAATVAAPTSSDSPEAVALPRPTSTDDEDGIGWLLPTALLLLVIGLVITGLALRRRNAP